MGVAEVFVPGKSQSKIFKQWHIVGKYNEVIDLALGFTFTLSSGGRAHAENVLVKINERCTVLSGEIGT